MNFYLVKQQLLQLFTPVISKTRAITKMRWWVLPSLLLLLGACEQANDDGPEDGAPPERPAWVLIWNDEFDGATLDASKWEIQIGDGLVEGVPNGWGNNELQYYTDRSDNVAVANGNLVITSLADNPVPDPAFGDDPSYTFSSGRIRTQGLFDFTYGRVEARIKMPAEKGVWSAFWLLGSDPSPYGGWPAKGEIDIIEAYFRGDMAGESFFSAAAHWGARGVSGGACQDGASICQTRSFGDFDLVSERDGAGNPISFDHYDGYHVYAVEWDAQQIRWYIDDFNFFSLRAETYWNYYNSAEFGYRPGDSGAPFDTPFHIILNSAVGGTLPDAVGESPLAGPAFLGEMMVDYVRVYQCSDSANGGAGCRNDFDPAGDNYTFEYLALEAEADDAFSVLNAIYIDGPGPEQIPVLRDLAFNAVNGLTITELSDPDFSGNYLDIVAPSVSAGNVPGFSIIDPTGSDFVLAGFTPQGLGDIKFNFYVESDSVNPNGNMRVSIIAGGARSSVIIPLNSFAVDEWHQVFIPIEDILTGGPNGIDVGSITELIRFEFADAHVRIDNLLFACGGNPCGIVDEVPVFIDDVSPIWDRGIVGDDTDQRFLFNNPNYTDGTQYHVQWREVDTGDPFHDTVIETSFGNTGTVGAVNFIGASTAVPSIAALTFGEFSFDIRMISNPNDVELLFKVDAVDPVTLVGTSTGEQPLGDLPVVGPNGPWTRFTCPIATLEAQGLDTSKITAPFVLVPGNRGAGQGVVVQWDNVTFSPVATGGATPLALPLVFDSLPGFCLPIQPFAGAGFAIDDNPGPDAVNGNSRVGRIKKFDPGNGELFGGIAIQLSTNIDFGPASSNVGKAFRIKTWSARAGMPVTFKLESQPGVGPERVFTTTVANAWEEFIVDFAGEGSNSYPTLTIIIDNGVVGDGGDDFTLFVDQIEQIDSTSNAADLSTVYNFDQPNTTYPLTDFGEARSSVSTGPAGDPGNDGLMGEVTLNDFAFTIAGTIMGGAEGFGSPIPFTPTRQQIRVRVHTPSAGTDVILKIEDSVDQFQADEDTQTTSAAGWQTLVFDFSDANLADTFEKLIIIFAPGQSHNGETYYWDDVELLP